MKREELEKEAEGWLNKWELCNKCKNKVDCISNFSYCKKVVLQSYLASAEPREKRIAELEAQIEKMKRCEICDEYTSGSCNYHSYSQQVCKENGMKLFKLKEIKEK